MPVILGAIVNILLRLVTDWPPGWQAVFVVALGIAYAVLYLSRKRPRRRPLSRRAVTAVTVGLVLTIVLIVLVGLVFGLNAMIFLVFWLVLMIIVVRCAPLLPDGSVAATSLLILVAAYSMGVALSVGAIPLIKVAFAGGHTEVTIRNGCNSPLVYPPLNITIPAHDKRSIDVPPLSTTIKREESQVLVQGAYEIAIEIPRNADLRFDSQPIGLGSALTVRLWESQSHELTITCT